MDRGKRKYTVNEVVSMLEDEGGYIRADIHIQPPPVSDLTDEDSGDEDEEVTYDNLSGRQLGQPASATIIHPDGRNVIDTDETQNDVNNDDNGSDTDEYEVPDNITVSGPSSRQDLQCQRRGNPRRKPHQQYATGKKEIFRRTSQNNLYGGNKMLIPLDIPKHQLVCSIFSLTTM